jgi:hypothetical protein
MHIFQRNTQIHDRVNRGLGMCNWQSNSVIMSSNGSNTLCRYKTIVAKRSVLVEVKENI